MGVLSQNSTRVDVHLRLKYSHKGLPRLGARAVGRSRVETAQELKGLLEAGEFGSPPGCCRNPGICVLSARTTSALNVC